MNPGYGYNSGAGRRPNPLVFALAACGGCVLVMVVGLAIAGFLGFKVFKTGVAAIKPAQTIAEGYLTSLRDHKYAGAASLLTQSGKPGTLTESVQMQTETVERTHGRLQSWTFNNVAINSVNGDSTLTLGYRLQYERGAGKGIFTFAHWSGKQAYPQITRFEVENGN